MLTGTIAAVRPATGCSGTMNVAQSCMFQFWVKAGGEKYTKYLLTNLGNTWYGFHVPIIATGVPWKCKRYQPGHAQFTRGNGWAAPTSRDDDSWDTHRYTAGAGEGRALTWTADADWDYVAIKAYYAASFGDLALALTGEGTLIKASVDCCTAASPYKRTDRALAYERWVTIATGVKAGDVITINSSSPVDKNIRVEGILGWNEEAGDPSAEECDLITDHGILYAGEPGSNPDIVQIMDGNSEAKGNVGTLSVKSNGQIPTGISYTGSCAHSDAYNRLTDAAGTGVPTVEMVYYDSGHVGGASWAPAIRDILVCDALKVVCSGKQRMGNFGGSGTSTLVGSYVETHVFDPQGYSVHYELLWDGELPATPTLWNGYWAMAEFSPAVGAVVVPALKTHTPLVKEDASFLTLGKCFEIWFVDGDLGEWAVVFQPNRVKSSAGGVVFIEERAPAQFSSNKIYCEQTPYGTTALTITANMITSGGYSLSVVQKSALQEVSGTLPTADNVYEEETFGSVEDPTSGTLTLPDPADVKDGTEYGVGGDGETGTMELGVTTQFRIGDQG